MQRPDPTEYPAFFAKYIELVPEAGILAEMASQLDEMLAFLRAVPEVSARVCHPPYTWTFKEVIGHVADGERVFGYRALRFGRGDPTPLASFVCWVCLVGVWSNRLAFADVVSDFEAARRSNLWLFRNLPAASWTCSGEVSGNRLSVRALAYIIVGHARHHMAILRKRLSAN